jgi:hypothetical protein
VPEALLLKHFKSKHGILVANVKKKSFKRLRRASVFQFKNCRLLLP